MGRKVSIVFEEESENSKEFKVYLEGVPLESRIMPEEEQLNKLPAVEFWGFKMFGICYSIMRRCKVLAGEK